MPIIEISSGGRRKRIVFSFIPKTGGTSVMKFFMKIGARAYFHNENNGAVGVLRCPTQHFHYDLLDSCCDLEAADFSFTIVRDPEARARSDYLWSLRRIQNRDSLPSFETWFDRIQNMYSKNTYYLDNHIRPQSEFIGEKIRKVYYFEQGLEGIMVDVLKNTGIVINGAQIPDILKKENASENMGSGLKSSDVQVSGQARRSLHEFYKNDYNLGYN